LLALDAEKGPGIKLAKKFNAHSFPTTILLNPDASEIDRLTGYLPKSEFLKVFSDYSKGIGTLDVMQEQLVSDPVNFKLKLDISAKLAERGEGLRAQELQAEIIEADPLNASGLADNAAAQLAISEFRSSHSVDPLNKVLQKWPGLDDGPQIYNILISVASRDGDNEKRRRLLDQSVKDFPDDISLLNSWAWIATESEWDLDLALKYARRAVKLSDGSPNILDTLAEVHILRGEKKPALKAINKALKKNPGDEYLLKQKARIESM
jgi:tetratricopeptide (TPR) repeat protein